MHTHFVIKVTHYELPVANIAHVCAPGAHVGVIKRRFTLKFPKRKFGKQGIEKVKYCMPT